MRCGGNGSPRLPQQASVASSKAAALFKG
jgi:hypothetical protein